MIQSHLKGNAWYKVHSILQFLKSLRHNCLTFELYNAELEFPWSPSLFTRLPLLGVSISRQKFAMSAASSLGVYKEAMHKCILEILIFCGHCSSSIHYWVLTLNIWDPHSTMKEMAWLSLGEITCNSSGGIYNPKNKECNHLSTEINLQNCNSWY